MTPGLTPSTTLTNGELLSECECEDTGTEAEIIELLRNLHEQRQLTLLVATHDETVAAAAQRVVRLKDGQIDGED